VGQRNYQSVVDAAEACPGECIFIELDVASESDAA
jgi:ferredoxin